MSVSRLAVMLLVLLAGFAPAAPGADNDLGRMQVRKLAPVRYVYLTTRSSFEGGRLGRDIDKFITRIFADAKAHKFPAFVPTLIFTYEGVGKGPEFTFSMGFDLPRDFKPDNLPEGYKFAELPEFNAATAIYTGNIEGIGRSWGELNEQAQTTLLEREGTSREYYLYWEGGESNNNVVLFALGLKEK